MDAAAFEWKLQQLLHEANTASVQIDDIYKALHGQALITETLLKLEIERAYNERFK